MMIGLESNPLNIYNHKLWTYCLKVIVEIRQQKLLGGATDEIQMNDFLMKISYYELFT